MRSINPTSILITFGHIICLLDTRMEEGEWRGMEGGGGSGREGGWGGGGGMQSACRHAACRHVLRAYTQKGSGPKVPHFMRWLERNNYQI